MIEYKASSNESLISVSDDLSFTTNLKNCSISLSIESNSASPSGSNRSVASESSVLSPKQLHSHDWPEFQESYNSIMDNTNLLDSCAAALCDISAKGDRSPILTPEKVLWTYNRSFSFERSSVRHMSVKSDQAKGIDTETTTQTNTNSANKMAQFSIWLNQMEEFVEAQPKLSKIFTMNSKQMIAQKVIHSKLFKEIIGQSCIVKGFKQHEYKLIEERYHLLYLKVYEVLLLLEGLPKDEASMSDEIDAAHYLNVHVDNDVNNIVNSSESNQNESANSSLTNVGVYHFKYMEPESKQAEQSTHDNGMLEKMSSTIYETCDKEFTFDSDLQSLLDSTDTNHLLTSEDSSVPGLCLIPLQHQTTEETIIEVQNGAPNEFSELLLQQQQPPSQEQNICNHNKVYDWLLTNTGTINRSKSSISLKSTCDRDIRSLYRMQSSMALKVSKSSPSFRALANEKFQGIEYSSEQSINSCGTTESNSLIWDNFQSECCASESDTNGNSIIDTSEIAKLMNNLCYFGDDYSQHFNIGNSSTSASSDELNSTTTNSVELSHETELSKNISRTKRCPRRKRSIGKRMNTKTSSSCSEVSVSNISTASTLPTSPTSPAIDSSADEFGEKITYNSDDKTFEVHDSDTTETKKIKVGQMRPEDFHYIVKMCQNNIDCVITVLGAEPNRILTVSYCQQMKNERHQNDPSRMRTCKCDNNSSENKSSSGILSKGESDLCDCLTENIKQSTCVCAWVSHTIAMILHFLIDCWNIFRNMKLYTYLGRVIKAFFSSARYMADHFNTERKTLQNKPTKFL